MVKVKLCGNRTIEDVEATADADAQGFIVWADSPRALELETAAELLSYVPPFNRTVLVTRSTDPLMLADLVEALEPDVLQVHVELSPVQLERIRRTLPARMPLIAVLAIGPEDTPAGCLERAERMAEGPLHALVLDTRRQGRTGGTGAVHDWSLSARIREALAPLPVILAGGLNPENVAEAVRIVRPYAVDVASGVETDGRKDPTKVRALLHEVRCR